MLKAFGDNIWIAEDEGPAVAGFHYGIRMVVIRLSAGTLFVWSPIALSPELKDAVEALGDVAHIVAPNAFHHLYLGDWQAAFPDAFVCAPPGLRKKRPDIRFDRDLIDGDAAEWGGDVECVLVAGNIIFTEAVFFHAKSKTVIFTDLIQHFAPDAFSGWRAWIARADLMIAPEATVPRKFRVSFINRKAAKAALKRILDWPIENVLIAHGQPIEKDGKGVVERAFHWLL